MRRVVYCYQRSLEPVVLVTNKVLSLTRPRLIQLKPL